MRHYQGELRPTSIGKVTTDIPEGYPGRHP
jgi:hypothetical protein